MARVSSGAALVLLAVLLAAGCGGGTKQPLSLASTRSCLVEEGVSTTRELGDDFIASTAPGGALRADLGQNMVTISFGEDETQADQIANAYRRFKGQNIGIENVLRVRRNAVLLWEEMPTPGDEAVVTDCLK